ncbi:unnamed protein product, partial [Phaeothamnion confervicola]
LFFFLRGRRVLCSFSHCGRLSEVKSWFFLMPPKTASSNAALQSKIHKAAQAGDAEGLALAVELGALDIRDYWQKTPLHSACNAGNLETVLFLLGAGALVDPQDKDGQTPLHLAVSKGYLSVVVALLDGGASHKCLNSAGDNAMHIAAMSAEGEIIEELLKRGAKSTYENLNGFLPEELTPDDKVREILTKSHPTKFAAAAAATAAVAMAAAGPEEEEGRSGEAPPKP